MKVTPVDLVHKSFNKKMMGYDPDEVHQFLDELGKALESLIQERNQLKEQIREKELSILDYKERDQMLKSTLATASNMSDKIRTDAEREAKLILTDAHQKAEIITRDSRDSLKKTYQEITELKKMRMQFEANLKALAQSHLALLEQGEKYMPSTKLGNLSILEEELS